MTADTFILRAEGLASPMIECIPWLQELFAEPADVRAGIFHVNDAPGASTAFDPERFEESEEYRIA